MTLEERERLIAFIKANDHTYNYNCVNFRYYSNFDLLIRKGKLEKKLKGIEKTLLIP